MISQISGKLISKQATELVVDCNGVGFLLFVSVTTSEQMPELNTNVTLQTLLISREDSVQLFGFFAKIEREIFKLLISISGIGPKSAIAILSSISISEFRQAILANDLLLLQKMPGIGKKTAERIIIELRDKIGKIETVDLGSVANNTLISQEAISALVVLGYNKSIAEKAVKRATSTLTKENITTEELIRIALKLAMESK